MKELQLTNQNTFENRIDFFGLSDDVLAARNQGKSYVTIARELNKEHIKELNGVVITPKVVSDWCKKNIIQEQSTTKEYEIINTYNEQKNLLEMVETQIEMIQVFLDDLQCQQANNTMPSDTLYERMKSLMLDQEKYIARKQAILRDMQSIAEKIFTFQSMHAVITETLNIIERKDPDLRKQIEAEMKENRILVNNYENIRQK